MILELEGDDRGSGRDRVIETKGGWGTWIRTRDGDTKNRCLTAWLYPNASPGRGSSARRKPVTPGSIRGDSK
ncbi:hypothetical protein HOE425_331899 [Hoeflea sp. EC-HK425]|nr:hypothetical protein HOE425_331899 [Hoeflea sp. EC-HK425]